MAKRILAAMAGIGILMGLAYYSGSLTSERALEQERARLLAQIESLELLTREQAAAGRDTVRAETTDSTEKQPEGRETREPDEEALDTALFYLKERDGYLAIYREDGTTLYETTDIPLSLLPEALQQEIRAGKSVESEQALYDFLENYSS
ncbi:hypothetical protein LK511_04580 [Faecalicatena orotica]|nr:hypothetical protein [Faecalicatena orotica]